MKGVRVSKMLKELALLLLFCPLLKGYPTLMSSSNDWPIVSRILEACGYAFTLRKLHSSVSEFVHRAGVRVIVLAAERMVKRRFLIMSRAVMEICPLAQTADEDQRRGYAAPHP